jgi:hypothetical protein
MTIDPTTRQAIQGATRAAVSAISDAATNAAKKGGDTSEIKVTISGLLMTGALGALSALAVLPGPWTIPVLALSAMLPVGAYALSRGKVKSAALQAAADVVLGHVTADKPGDLIAPTTNIVVEDGGAALGAAAGKAGAAAAGGPFKPPAP